MPSTYLSLHYHLIFGIWIDNRFSPVSRPKAPAAAAPKRRYGAPRRREGWRSPKRVGLQCGPGNREAFWSAVVLYSFRPHRAETGQDFACPPSNLFQYF